MYFNLIILDYSIIVMSLINLNKISLRFMSEIKDVKESMDRIYEHIRKIAEIIEEKNLDHKDAIHEVIVELANEFGITVINC